ncbi:MAG: hypothetical protein EOP00_32400, partial [Pedobacter sp.]
MDKITLINKVIKNYFDTNGSIKIIPAKDLMPQFIQASIFEKDEKNGLPIRKILRKLDAQNQLEQIPYIFADRKAVNTNWYFQRETGVIHEPKITNKLLPDKLSFKPSKTPKQRDEDYVLDLCDEIL